MKNSNELNKVFNREINIINDYLLNRINTGSSLFNKNMQKLILAGGKRLRPLVLLLSARLAEGEKYFQRKEDKFYTLAAAVEILHMATLIHDDVIDEAKTRRGNKSVHHQLDSKRALFVGDFFLSRAYSLFHQYLSQELLNRVDRTIQSICEGVFLEFNNRGNLDISFTSYLKQIRCKTALLFGLAAYLGAYGSDNSRKLSLLYRCGLKLGIAFQLQDDLLDFMGTESKMGKPVGQDLTNGEYSLPIILLLRHQENNHKVKNILQREKISSDEVEILKKLMRDCGVLAEVEKIKQRYFSKALNSLQEFPAGPDRQKFELILKYQKKREL